MRCAVFWPAARRPEKTGRCARGNPWCVGFHAELMEWMPPPDGIAMCQSDVCNNVTQRREHP